MTPGVNRTAEFNFFLFFTSGTDLIIIAAHLVIAVLFTTTGSKYPKAPSFQIGLV